MSGSYSPKVHSFYLPVSIFNVRHFLIVSLFIFWAVQSAAQDSSGIQPTRDSNKKHQTFGQTKTIIRIDISGNKRTNTAVILREMSIAVGDKILADSLSSLLQLNFQRLYNLNIFTDIKITSDTSGNEDVVFYVALKEQWFIIPQADIQLADRNLNVWWNEHNHDLSRINLGIYLLHKNLSGRLDRLTVSTHFGYTQQFTATYYRPYIDKAQKQGIGFGAGVSRSKELAYATSNNKLLFTQHNKDFLFNTFFANASWYYRPAYKTRHIISVGYYQYNVGDTISQLNNDFFTNSTQLSFAELTYRYEYNGVDNWNYPRRGVKIVGSVASRFGISGMSYQGIANLELGYFKKLNHRFYSSFVFRGRATVSQNQPYFLQSAFGYKTNYVRGYEYYVVEANHFAIGRFSLKYEAVKHQFHHLPFRFLPELPLWIYPKMFFDCGYASNNLISNNNTLANTLLYSFGFGVDVITAYDLKLRIEIAINHLGENGVYLHANSE